MTLHYVPLAGERLPVRFDSDVEAFSEWLRRRGPVAVDTETTGLDIFRTDYRLRLLIVGDREGAWVLPAEWMAPEALKRVGRLLEIHAAEVAPICFHNATFDRLVLDRAGVLPLVGLSTAEWEDTRLQAHLLDPRAKQEGGLGHGLKDLSDFWIDSSASAEGQEALRAVFKENRWSKDEGWSKIDLDQEDFVRYAGLDAILTARLFALQEPHMRNRDYGRLYAFEKEVAALCARMERRGLLVDAGYVEGSLLPFLEEMEAEGLKEAASWGVENVNATAQVAEALAACGWTAEEFTPTGKPKVDKAVLEALGDDYPVAAAVMKAKRAGKWMASYAYPLLEDVDSEGRIHPKINSLQARTARMSVARPPLQQLPSGDWRIRRAIVADPGKVLWAADYEQIEMRVLAAMAQEPKMLEGLAAGVDFHDYTAEIVFGPDFTKAQRKLAKGVGFGKVYGGGAVTIARQTGAPIEDVKRAIAAYDSGFRGIRRFQKKLEARAEVGERAVVTASGRHLPLDGDRLYAATNYVVQSTSRDVLAQALLDLEDAGLDSMLLLPIHDEILGECPADEFEETARVVGEVMSGDFLGVRLDAAAELYGPSWGHGYGAEGPVLLGGES